MIERSDIEQGATVEGALSRFWDAPPKSEVWSPPGLPVFKVGDRVQIRLNGECQHVTRDIDALTGEILSPDVKGHPIEVNGRIGFVESIDDPVFSTPQDGHGYCVMFDDEFWMKGGPLVGMALAAIELRLLTTSSGQAGGEDGAE